MKVLQNLTNDLFSLKSHSKFKLVEKGKWYHFQRVYLIKSSDDNYGLISLNFFERLLRNVCKVNHFKKEAFEGRSITVINPKNSIEQKINDRTRGILNTSNEVASQDVELDSIKHATRVMEERLSSELEKINLKDLEKAYIQMYVGGKEASHDINLVQVDFLSKFKEYASSVLHGLNPPINAAYSVLLEDKNGKFYAMANTFSVNVSEDRIRDNGTLHPFKTFENKEEANQFIQSRMERFKSRI